MRVYCHTCQAHLARYVLGRGYVGYNKAGAAERVAAHEILRPGHVVVICKETRSSSPAGKPVDRPRGLRPPPAEEGER